MKENLPYSSETTSEIIHMLLFLNPEVFIQENEDNQMYLNLSTLFMKPKGTSQREMLFQ